jgi:excisionase family DNA binding protein
MATPCTLEPLLVKRSTAASLLGISVRPIDYLLAAGRLRSRKIGGRVLIPTGELHGFVRADRLDPMVPVTLCAGMILLS